MPRKYYLVYNQSGTRTLVRSTGSSAAADKVNTALQYTVDRYGINSSIVEEINKSTAKKEIKKLKKLKALVKFELYMLGVAPISIMDIETGKKIVKLRKKEFEILKTKLKLV